MTGHEKGVPIQQLQRDKRMDPEQRMRLDAAIHRQGRGWFTTEFARYEILPEMLVPAVVEQARKLGNLDESADD